MPNRYRRRHVKLMFLSPDGEAVREGDFDNIAEAEARWGNIGSRWFFYPIGVIVTGVSDTIVQAPEGWESWHGKKLGTLKARLHQNPLSDIELCDSLPFPY